MTAFGLFSLMSKMLSSVLNSAALWLFNSSFRSWNCGFCPIPSGTLGRPSDIVVSPAFKSKKDGGKSCTAARNSVASMKPDTKCGDFTSGNVSGLCRVCDFPGVYVQWLSWGWRLPGVEQITGWVRRCRARDCIHVPTASFICSIRTWAASKRSDRQLVSKVMTLGRAEDFLRTV